MRIRVIPMSLQNEEFVGKTVKQVQISYFVYDLVNKHKNWYFYQTNGLIADEGDLLLFQMDNEIIASAEFYMAKKFLNPDLYGNNGALILKKNSIRVFKPINKNDFSKIVPKFKGFSQAKQDFDLNDVNFEELKVKINNKLEY